MTLKKLYESIVISPLHGGRKWVTIKDIEYTFKSFWEDFTVYIKKGFEFDGASVPKIFHWIWTPMWTDTLPGALFHDYLYRMQYTTREQADQCFNELMIRTKTNPNKRKRFYIWVRIWGWVAWNRKKTKK
jgi:hypothetical protein